MVKPDKLITGTFLIIIIALFGSLILPEIASNIFENQTGQLTDAIIFLVVGFMLFISLSLTISVTGGKQ